MAKDRWRRLSEPQKDSKVKIKTQEDEGRRAKGGGERLMMAENKGQEQGPRCRA